MTVADPIDFLVLSIRDIQASQYGPLLFLKLNQILKSRMLFPYLRVLFRLLPRLWLCSVRMIKVKIYIPTHWLLLLLWALLLQILDLLK